MARPIRSRLSSTHARRFEDPASPVARAGTTCCQRPGLLDYRCERKALPRCVGRRRGVLPGPWASRCAGCHARADRRAGLCAYEFLLDGSRGGAGRYADCERPGRHHAHLSGQRRLGSDGSRAQTGAPVLRREGRAAAREVHRTPQQLPRQHAGCARGRRQRVAAPAVRAAADRCRARGTDVFISRSARWRDSRAVRRAAGRGTRSDDRARGWQQCHRVRGRDRRRRHQRLPDALRPATSGVCANCATRTAFC